MSILYSKALREYKKSTFKIGDRVRISKYDSPFRTGYKPQFTRRVFEFVAIATLIPPTYKIKDEQCEIILGKFYQKELIQNIQQWIRLQQCWFLTLLENCFQTTHSVPFKNFSPEQVNLDGLWEVAISEISYA